MRILIVGNGGREHALLWKLHRDVPDAEFFITKGNGGTAGLATAIPLEVTEFQALAGWAIEQRIDLAVVGPDLPLALGIVDHFAARGVPAFGPTAAAAEIESSKAFAKRLMQRNGIPTAGFEVFAEPGPAIEHVVGMAGRSVVKASGLAAGKGAIVCLDTDEAVRAIREIFGGAFGSAGEQVVVEECMDGEEISVFAISDGESIVTLLPAQDHKRVGEGDTGPNTGGMGAYAPVSIATEPLLQRIHEEILEPTIRALGEEGRPYRGVLYAGLMITDEGPKVVEFNARFGDPEAQAILPLLESSLYDLIVHVLEGSLSRAAPLRWRPGAAVTTILASKGYPGAFETGFPIDIPAEVQEDDSIRIFHAGTSLRDNRLVTSGGRVLAVTALDANVAAAADRSRAAAERISFDNSYLRRDIGWREAARATGTP